MLDAGLFCSRLVHFLAVLSLFGAALYPLYTFRPGVQSFAVDEPFHSRRKIAIYEFDELAHLARSDLLLEIFEGLAIH